MSYVVLANCGGKADNPPTAANLPAPPSATATGTAPPTAANLPAPPPTSTTTPPPTAANLPAPPPFDASADSGDAGEM